MGPIPGARSVFRQLRRVQLAKGADGSQNWARTGPIWGMPIYGYNNCEKADDPHGDLARGGGEKGLGPERSKTMKMQRLLGRLYLPLLVLAPLMLGNGILAIG